MRGAASCRAGDSIAEIGVNGAACHIGASNPIPCSFHSYRTASATRVDKVPVGESGGSGQNAGGVCGRELRAWSEGSTPVPVSRSVCVLALRRRLRRSPGPERQTPHRLLLLGGVRRRPAIGRWSPRQLFPSLRFAATHRIAALAVECAQSQRGIRPLKALRRDAAPYRPSLHRAAQGCGVLQALFFSAPSTQYWGCTGV